MATAIGSAKNAEGRRRFRQPERLGEARQRGERWSQKHVDFLVCRNDDWMPMLAIELDDSSHDNKRRYKADRDKNDIFAAIGLPLLRLPLDEINEHEELVRQLSEAWHQRWHLLETGLPPPKQKPVRKPLFKLWTRKAAA